jgi:pyruvate dehydrogenase (quinone)
VADAWDEALASDRPVLYEAVTDPEVPPLPPHIKFEQAKGLASAIAKGDPAAGRIIRQSVRSKLKEFTNRP